MNLCCRLLQNLSQRLISIPENEILHQAAQAAAAAAAVAAAAAALVSSTLSNSGGATVGTVDAATSTDINDNNQEMDIDILQVGVQLKPKSH